MTNPNPQVFSIREDHWQVYLQGKVLPIVWNSKGAALAGLKVELRRAQARTQKSEKAKQ